MMGVLVQENASSQLAMDLGRPGGPGYDPLTAVLIGCSQKELRHVLQMMLVSGSCSVRWWTSSLEMEAHQGTQSI